MSTSAGRKTRFADWHNNDDKLPYTTIFEKAAQKGKMKQGVVKMKTPYNNQENLEVGERMGGYATVKMIINPIAEGSRDSIESTEYSPAAMRSTMGGASMISRSSVRRSSASDFSTASEKRSFECSTSSSNSSFILHQRRQQRLRERSEKRKSMTLSSKGGGTSDHSRKESSIPDVDMIPIPKFGDWDESDPKSGEDFTYKFNKIKEEKSKSKGFATILASNQNKGNGSTNQSKSFSISKMCCFQPFPRKR